MLTRIGALLLLLLTPVAWAGPPCWQVNHAQSALVFKGDQAGAVAKGVFENWKSHFCFSPDTAQGVLRVSVNLASLNTHNSRRDEILRGADFFAVKKYPKATFKATTFTRVDASHFVARGSLSLRGVTHSIKVPFVFKTHNNKAQIKGTTTLKRKAFGIGQGRWGNTRWVGNKVALVFNLEVARAQSHQAGD